MTRLAFRAAVMMLAAAACSAAAARNGAGTNAAQRSSTAQAEAFVDRLFARYARASTDDPGPDSRAQWEDEAVFTPATAALLDRANAFAPPDEVPEFADGDFDCQCQDWENLQVTEKRSRALEAGRVEVEIRFVNAGEAKQARLIVEPTPSGPRIADLFDDATRRAWSRR